MPAEIKIDQATLSPAGVAGYARTDGLDTGALVTLTSTGGGTTHRFELLWVPTDDTTAVASLAVTGTPSIWTFTPDTAVYGTYRIRLIVDEGLSTQDSSIRIFAIRTPVAGLVIPALNERSDPRANLAFDTAETVEASENNEPIAGGPFAGGSYGGWYPALADLITTVDSGISGGGPPTGAAGGQLSGTYPNPNVIGLRETSGPTNLTLGAVADGEVLVRSGATLIGSTGGPPGGAAGGQLGGTYPNPDVRGIRETSGASLLTVGAIADGQFLVRAGLTVVGTATPTASGAAGGQLGGTYPNPDVRGLRETGGATLLTLGAIADGEVLARSGTTVVGTTPTASGTAGGQLSGSYPNPDVIGVVETGGPTSLTVGAIDDGQDLRRSGTSIIGVPPPVMWQWNQADVTQFSYVLTSTCVGPAPTAPTIAFDNTSGCGNLAKFSCTTSNNLIGYVFFSINDLTLAVNRFIFRVRYAGAVINGGLSAYCSGAFLHNDTPADFIGYGCFAQSTGGQLINAYAEGAASVAAQAPFVTGPAAGLSCVPSVVAPFSGTMLEFEVIRQNATVSETQLPMFFARSVSNGLSAYSIAPDELISSSPPSVFLSNNDLNSIGFGFYFAGGGGSGIGTHDFYISDMQVLRHPLDL